MIEDLFLDKTVALIGNSVILNSQEYGKLIDEHDVVCRINKGPLICNPSTHGIRTDVLFYGNPGIILPEVPEVLTKEVIYVLTHFKFENQEQPKGKIYKLSRDIIDKIKFDNGYIEKKNGLLTGLLLCHLYFLGNLRAFLYLGLIGKRTLLFIGLMRRETHDISTMSKNR
jgi:hypothetical protein